MPTLQAIKDKMVAEKQNEKTEHVVEEQRTTTMNLILTALLLITTVP